MDKTQLRCSDLIYHDVHDEHDGWLPPQHDAKRRYARSASIVVLVVYVVVSKHFGEAKIKEF